MTKCPTPYPLFDSIHDLEQGVSPWHQKYLGTLISNALEEYTLACKFLLSYRGSLDTFTSYRREVERLCQWCWLIKKIPLCDMEREHMAEYIRFVQNPPLDWVANKHSSRFSDGTCGTRLPVDTWRPFLKRQHKSDSQTKSLKNPIQQATLRAIIASASTFFTYLLQEGYVQKNPVILLRQKGQIIQKHQNTRITRKLSQIQWEVLIDMIEKKARANGHFERHLFALSAFFLLGVRISELAESQGRTPMMQDFYRDSDGLWWFKTIGKGNKLREVAVPDAMCQSLRRYRTHLGLSVYPSPTEASPLIPKQRGVGGIGIRMLRKTVQEAFDLTIDKLKLEGKNEEATHMQSATVHWLRHTAISHDVTHRPREHVRDDAGHQSVQITDRYIDIDVKARHASARHKTLTQVLKED